MNTGLLAVAILLSILVLLLLLFSFWYSRHLLTRVADLSLTAPVDLTNDAGELDPMKQIRHLKKFTQEFLLKYEELKFGKMLGKGSQGEVYRAVWRGSTVAVKKVDTRKVQPEIIEEFCQEAQIMRRLRHPSLTLFMGVSLEHPHLCIVTEIVSRGSLFDIIHDETGALTWQKCIGIAVDVARGLTYLHAHSPPILHRDLKSLNILVDENWRGKVADFGMTRFQEDGTMTQCGSPLWMSPEMIRNDPYDEKSDVYSFAICMWEMYTRKIPYRELGLNPSHLVVKVVKEHLRPPIPKQCPKPYKQLMEKCWSPSAEKRPTFPQILKVMEGFLNDPTIMNHKPQSSRETQTVVVRGDDTNATAGATVQPDAAAAQNNLLALPTSLLAVGSKQWKLDSSEVTFYNESSNEMLELAAAANGGILGAQSESGGGLGLGTGGQPSLPHRGSSITRVKSSSATGSENSSPMQTGRRLTGTKDAAVEEGKEKENNKRKTPTTPHSDTNSLFVPLTSGSGGSATTVNTSGSTSSSSSTTNNSSSTTSEGTPAPLVHNTQIKSTKEAKTEEESLSSSGLPTLASQGPSIMLGKYRNKLVGIKPCYLSRRHLVLSNEERVAADLDGTIKDTKVDEVLKRVASLRHPNITLFMGACVDGIENLRGKLKETAHRIEETVQEEKTKEKEKKDSSSSSSTSLPYPNPARLTLPPPPSDCDYYLCTITEYMSRGTLHNILCDTSLVLDWNTMLDLLIDAASGMVYLHGTTPAPVIHSDLSSHHLLVDKNYRVKISNYGFIDLTAHINNTPLPPTIWSAPEYIKHPTMNNLTAAANVYSFGLVMWQALVRKPLYDNSALTKSLQDKIVKQGARPHLPNSLTIQKDLKTLIEKTWMADPHARPSFNVILEELIRLKKLGPPKITLKLGTTSATHKYRKAKTVYAYRSKDPVTILKDWGVNIGKKNCVIIFSGEDDVYLCDEEVFKQTYEKIDEGETTAEGGQEEQQGKIIEELKSPSHGRIPSSSSNTTSSALSSPRAAPPAQPQQNYQGEFRKIGTVLARCMEDAFSVKTNGGIEHGLAGDYLVQNEQGDQWSIEAKTFIDLYERWD